MLDNAPNAGPQFSRLVLHPRNLGGQILGGVMLGIGHARVQKWVYDLHYGVPLAKRFYQ